MKTTAKAHLLRTTLLAALCITPGMVSGAFAQDTVTAASGPQDDGDVVVITGTRIARTNADAESPLVTVTGETMAESGFTTVDQYLNTLPQITPGISSQSNNPSSNGRAFIDLRGLGTNRNLVLIDGRRGMGSTAGGVVDVNTIPAALIQNVEIVTGGAASTYGADAVSGVVNFILKKDFEGVEFDAQYRITEENDGLEWGGDMTMGGAFADGRGNAVFNASYFYREPMYKGARPFSAQASSLTGIYPGGSYSPGTNAPSAAAVNGLFGAGACQTSGGQGGFGFNPDGTLFCTGTLGNAFDIVGYTGPASDVATAFAPDVFSYNFEPDNILVLPMERWSLYSHITYDVNNHFKPYAQAMYTNYNALQELAPTPGGGFTVPVTNPHIPAQLAALLATRTTPGADFTFNKRFNQVGGRTGYNTHDVWQLTTGSTGDIVGSWTYDVYASYGRSVQNEIQGGNIKFPQFNAVLANPNSAAAGSGVCAAWNPFGTNSPMPQACSNFLNLNAKNLTVVEQSIVEATASGDLFALPAGMVQAAFGLSYRELDFDFAPDAGLVPGQVVGFNAQLPISGFLNWQDIFGEVLVPVVSDAPFAESVSVTLGYRSTDNNRTGVSDSWKVNGDWTVNDTLRFRGGIQTATRSPNIAELFAPQVPNFPNFSGQDPCNTTGSAATAANRTHPEYGRLGPNGANVAALCLAQAAVAGAPVFSQPFGQAQGIVGGNPNLEPETSESFTVGFVVDSPFAGTLFENANVSLDYWNIEIEDRIGAFGTATIIQRCYNRDGANPTYSINNPWCALFNRDQADGRVIDLAQLQDNRNFTATSGIDLAVNWGLDFGAMGQLDLGMVTTWVESYEDGTTVSSADPIYEFVGTIGATTGSAVPEWRHTISANWSWDKLNVGAVARYIDAMDHSDTITGGANSPVDETWYLDLTGRYDLTDGITLRGGVNNVLNQEPRLYSPNVQANTDPSTYDILGRRFFVGINFKM